MVAESLYTAIIGLPLLGFLIIGFLKNKISDNVTGILASTMVLIPFLIVSSVFFSLVNGGGSIHYYLLNWFTIGHYSVDYGIQLDRLSVVMSLFITGVGFLIHLYSVSYMKGDKNFSTYFSYLNLFIFFMLVLVLSDNYLGMYIGWEGVGLCSYFLIGFWYKNNEYSNAGKKAFVMNRVGDLGFMVGMFYVFYYTGSLEFVKVEQAIGMGAMTPIVLMIAASMFFVGATGKSAQIPLFTWLPDAMAGPTPVSALIHAATMVTAGIYMVIRSNFIYSLTPEVLNVVGIIGVASALYAAIVGMTQNDIKKVLAYSTVSQLGLMFLALGVGAYVTALFHVLTHAFFKALLFLGAGSVMHAVGGEQDIRKMGGLRKYMPITFATFLIASLAISGIPPFSGFFSKDEILAQAFQQNTLLWVLGLAASMMTAFYMFRLVFLTFYGEYRGSDDSKQKIHESPKLMTIPLVVLAILATVAGALGLPHVFNMPHLLNDFLSPILASSARPQGHLEASTELMLMGIATGGALASIAIAYMMYISKERVPDEDASYSGLTKVVYHKFYIDELYNAVIVRPIQWCSEFFHKVIDKVVVDGIVNMTGRASLLASDIVRTSQTGYTAFYILAMVLSACFILGYFFIGS